MLLYDLKAKIKETPGVISSVLPLAEWHVQLTTLPIKHVTKHIKDISYTSLLIY